MTRRSPASPSNVSSDGRADGAASRARPGVVTAALGITLTLAVFTIAFRSYLFIDLTQRHDMDAFAFLVALEGVIIAVPALILPVAALRPRPFVLLLLRVWFVVAALDALAWVVLTPPVGGFVAAVMSGVGHGGSSHRAEVFAALAAARWTWVVLKLGLLGWLFYVIHRKTPAWLAAHRPS